LAPDPLRAVQDFNGDGLVDVLTGGFGVALYPGEAGPAFGAPLTSPTLVGAQAGAADFDEDGDLDLVTTLFSTAVVLLNDGTGAFSVSVEQALPRPAVALVAGDGDGDGDADVVVSLVKLAYWETEGYLAWLAGDGAGGLQAAQQLLVPVGAQGVALAELMGDDLPDILVAHKEAGEPGAITVLNSDGAGGFDLVASMPTGSGCSLVLTEDLDQDGIVDLLALQGPGPGYNDNSFTVHAGLADGTFAPARRFATVGDLHFAATADVTGDGLPEVLVAAGLSYAIFVHSNLGPPVPFAALGPGLPGWSGTPTLTGTGELLPDALVTVTLSGAAATGPAFLVIGSELHSVAFQGGVLTPAPDMAIGPLVTDTAGAFVLAGRWPDGFLPNDEIFVQAWIVDTQAPGGFSASNGLVLTTP
jgi:hypothetical protein